MEKLISPPFIGDRLASADPADTLPTPDSRRLRAGDMIGGLFSRLVHPRHLWRAAHLHLRRKKDRHSGDDAQLALYSRILPSDFLHYGYFELTEASPEQISLHDFAAAQVRYAEQILELVGDRQHPVLDVGCGMGGLSRMLMARGFQAIALTPDRLQAAHVAATLPGVEVLRCKFERLSAQDHRQQFGTVINSESLQYLKLDQALPILETILRPGGTWVVADYFHRHPSPDRSCHVWDQFVEKVRGRGWTITHERDITANILPTLQWLHMLATRFGLPLMHFAFLRLRRKQPGLHHLLGRVLGSLQSVAEANVALIDPCRFEKERRYTLLALSRAPA
jgi:cyclopropane fatty-acyl-phospholipid synthase-like methyltransferase